MYVLVGLIAIVNNLITIWATPPDSNTNPKYITVMNNELYLDENGNLPNFIASDLVSK